MSDKWTVTPEQAKGMVINVGDEYFANGAWLIIANRHMLIEVVRRGYPTRPAKK